MLRKIELPACKEICTDHKKCVVCERNPALGNRELFKDYFNGQVEQGVLNDENYKED